MRTTGLRRRSIRLRDYDYGQPGAYFVTICTHDRQCWLGEIKDDELVPSLAGEIVLSTWQSLPRRFPGSSLDAFVAMPNHVHAVILIGTPDDTNVGAQFIAPDAKSEGVMNHAPTLGECVRTFKAISTRLIHQAGLKEFGWQRNYYEHIVRNDAELGRIRRYVLDNPLHWALDEQNPTNTHWLKSGASTTTR